MAYGLPTDYKITGLTRQGEGYSYTLYSDKVPAANIKCWTRGTKDYVERTAHCMAKDLNTRNEKRRMGQF